MIHGALAFSCNSHSWDLTTETATREVNWEFQEPTHTHIPLSQLSVIIKHSFSFQSTAFKYLKVIWMKMQHLGDLDKIWRFQITSAALH